MRRQNNILLACVAVFLLNASGVFAQPGKRYKEGELLVKFKRHTSSRTAFISHAGLGSHVARRFRRTGIELVRVKAGLTTKEAVKLYKQDPDVEYAEPNYKLYALDLFPNDPKFDNLWGLNNTGQTGGTPGADIDAPEAWQTTTGSNQVIVGVIDSGVDYNHQDLSANMWTNEAELNGTPRVDDDGNGYIDDVYGIDAVNDDTDPMDDNGHGTHCSGTIGAVGDNGIGVVGINWNVKIMPLKFLDNSGLGYADDAIQCLEYAIMMKQDYGQNIAITSNSWGGDDYSQALYDTIQDAAGAGILFVAAAGNDSEDTDMHPHYPSSYNLPNVVSVTATDLNDHLAWFSNWGLTSVDVAAPGTGILSCMPENNYAYMSGTSMAATYVSGLAALILAQHPASSWDQVKCIILSSVDPLSVLQGRSLSGGRINANAALAHTTSTLNVLVSSPSPGFVAYRNNPTVIRALGLACYGPAGAETVTVDFDNGDPSLTLHDDGLDPDVIADDGLHSGVWVPQMGGPVTLTFTISAPGYDPDSKQVFGAVDYPMPFLESISPTAGAYTQVLDLYGSNFRNQSQGMEANHYHGYKSLASLTHIGSGDTWIAGLYIWGDTHIKTMFHGLSPDTNGNYIRDEDEPATPPDDFDTRLGDYELKVVTIYFGDEDSSGDLSAADTIFQVMSTDPQIFELTDEPIIYKAVPSDIDCSYKDSSGVHWNVLRIYGWNFGQEQGGGEVCVGPYGWWTSNPLTLGFVEPFLIWSNHLIKVGFVVPVGWESAIRGKTGAVWIRKNGIYTDPKPLNVVDCDLYR